MITELKKLLRLHEGDKQFPYTDTTGHLTIGVGFNLTDVGLYPEEREFILDNRIKKAAVELDTHLPWVDTLDPVRQCVLLDMFYNLGPEPFNHNGYKDWPIFLQQVKEGKYLEASKNMRATLWAKQVKGRAVRLALMMAKGEWPNELT